MYDTKLVFVYSYPS